jgi:hypothetical protein
VHSGRVLGGGLSDYSVHHVTTLLFGSVSAPSFLKLGILYLTLGIKGVTVITAKN